MKKLTIIGLSVVIIVVCMLIWQHVKASRDRDDRDFRQSLAGVWSCEFDNVQCTNIVAADSSFTSQAILSYPERTNTYQMAGTWEIKDGSLIETVTSDSNKSALVPRTHSGQIVRVNTNNFIIAWQGSTNKSVWQRVSP